MWESIKAFWLKNRVMIIGGLMAGAIALQELLKERDVSWKVMGFAFATALLSWLARNLTGQIASILGILATSISVLAASSGGGSVQWKEFLVLMMVQILSVMAGPATQLRKP